MALEARALVRVGVRTYYPGMRLTSGDEVEMRRRPGFALLVEEGVLVEVEGGVESPRDSLVGVEQSVPQSDQQNDQQDQKPEESGEPEGFPCPYCDYVAKKELGLKSHIGRDHKDKKRKKR